MSEYANESIPVGKMDLDSDEYRVKQGDRRESWNMRFHSNKAPYSNVPAKMLGNARPNITFLQPPGTNKTLGSYQARQQNALISFVYNSQGRHQIRKYTISDNFIEVLVESPLFDWDPDNTIDAIDLVDDKLLWTDKKCRRLNITKASRRGKKLKTNIVVINGDFEIAITTPSGTSLFSFAPGTTVQQVIDTLLADTDFTTHFTAQICNGYIEVEQKVAEVGTIETIGTGGVYIPMNYYSAITEQTFSAQKDPFNGIPGITLMHNSNVTSNNLVDTNQQFRIQLIWDDYDRTTLSPVSDITLNLNKANWNFVRIDFTDPRLNIPALLGMIRNVQIFVRNGNIGKWLLVKKLNQADLWPAILGTNTFDFYNDRFYPAVDSVTASTLNDEMPVGPLNDKYSIGQTLFDDRVGYGPFKEGYDQACNNTVFKAEFTPVKSKKFKVRGKVRFASDMQFKTDGDEKYAIFHENGNGYRFITTQWSAGIIGCIYNLGPTGTPETPTPSLYGGASVNVFSFNQLHFGKAAQQAQQFLQHGGVPIYFAGETGFCFSKQAQSANVIYNQDGSIDALNGYNALKEWYDNYGTSQQIGDMYSTFELPADVGIHDMRVADPRCSIGDPYGLGFGPAYDMNNGLAFQRTSCPLWGFFDPTGLPFGQGRQIADFSLRINILNDTGDYELSSPRYGVVKTGTAIDGVIDVGEVYVRDLSCMDEILDTPGTGATWLASGHIIRGYLYDGITDTNPSGAIVTDVSKGIAIEGQIVRMAPLLQGLLPDASKFVTPDIEYDHPGIFHYSYGPFGPSDYTQACPTDHNGFFYFAHTGRADSSGPTPIGIAFDVLGASQDPASSNRIKKWGDNFAKGNLSDLFSNTLQPNTDQVRIYYTTNPNNPTCPYLDTRTLSVGSHDIILPCTNADFHNQYRTNIRGMVLDTDNNPIPLVPLVYERTGRVAITDINGQFSLAVFALAYIDTLDNYLWPPNYNAGSNMLDMYLKSIFFQNLPLNDTAPVDRIYDELLVNDFGANVVLTSQAIPIEITPFGTSGYNINTPYAPTILNPLQLTLTIQLAQRFLKAGSSYDVSIREVDTLGRGYDIIDIGVLYIPFWSENAQKCTFNGVPIPGLPNQQAIGYFTFSLDLTNMVPQGWTDKMRVFITPNETQDSELQFPAYDVQYVISYTPPQASTVEDSATDLVVEKTTFGSGSANRIWIGIPQAIARYNQFQNGSLVSWVYTPGDRLRIRNTADGNFVDTYLDVQLLGLSPDSNYFVIANQLNFPELAPGAVFEIYRPRLTTADDQTKIFYQIPSQADVVAGSFSPLILPLNTGDTYRRGRTVPIFGGVISVPMLEDNSVSDFYFSKVNNSGVAIVQTGFETQIEQTNAIRYSGKYFPNTRLNGLSSFLANSFVQTPLRLGKLTFIKVTTDDAYQQVVLATHENGCCTYYVGAAQLVGANGPDITVLTNTVLGSFRVLEGEYGCVDASSMVSMDGYIAWFDPIRGVFVRYARNGLTEISDKGFRYEASQIPANAKVVCVYDTYHEQFIWSIKTDMVWYSVAYDNAEEQRGWHGFIDLPAEKFGNIGFNTYAFKDGAMWLQESNSKTANFFGVQYSCSIRMVFNEDWKIMKAWAHLDLYASSLWWVPEMANRYGQKTRVLPNLFKNEEGVFVTQIMRDANTPVQVTPTPVVNGYHMRSQTCNILFQNDDDEFGVIFSAVAYSVKSPITGK